MRAVGQGRDGPRLLADVGGTNVRFAIQRPGEQPSSPGVLSADAFATLADAARAYLADVDLADRPRIAAFAVASPVVGDRVDMTNRNWSFSIDALRRKLRVDRLLVVNDLEAVALALPVLDAADLVRIGQGTAQPDAPSGVVAPGTGLGMAGLIPRDGGHIALASEGGHATMSAADEAEDAVIAWLRRDLGHVSAERVLSGPGLVNLRRALAAIRGLPDEPELTPAEIGRRALAGTHPLARATAEMFSGMLGTVAGNLALTLGARGGIYIAGGVVPRLRTAFDRERFRRRFEDKGRFQPYLASIPTWLVTHKTPALLGLATLLDRG